MRVVKAIRTGVQLPSPPLFCLRDAVKTPTVLTIGHSTRPIDEFIRLLQAHGVEMLVDVRTMPRSRYNPQFEREALARSLAAAGIDYLHLKELGGLRKPRTDSINAAWRN